ncbi:MAG: glycosyltransferase [Thermoanaerobaculia bacterium]
MNILFVAPYAPGHVRVRSFHLLRHLRRRGHEVTLLSLAWPGDGQSRVAELEAEGVRAVSAPIGRVRSWTNCLIALLRGQPMQARHSWSPALARRLREEIARSHPDVLHIEHLRGACYALDLDGVAPAGSALRVWDSVDCISALLAQTVHNSHSGLWRLAARLELAATRRYEARVARTFDRVLLASDHDVRALSDTVATTRFAVLPNGVDLDAFPYHDPGDRGAEVVFSGAMSYHANTATALHLVDTILPRVWAERPDARLTIVGSSPPRTLLRHAGRAAERLRITGWVPSVQPYLAAAAVAAMPMRYGAGTQIKVLEAMASGTPVVTDPRTAGAIGAAPGRELLVARTDEEFAAAILGLLGDPARRRSLAEAGRRRVESELSWERAAETLEHHYRDALAARP